MLLCLQQGSSGMGSRDPFLCPCKTQVNHQNWLSSFLADHGYSAPPAPCCCRPPELGMTTFFSRLHIQYLDGITALLDVNGVMNTDYLMLTWTELNDHFENVMQEN